MKNCLILFGDLLQVPQITPAHQNSSLYIDLSMKLSPTEQDAVRKDKEGS